MGKFQTKIKNQYEKKGYKVVKLIRLSENGYPDLLCLKDSIAIWVEVKEANDTLKELQKIRINELINNGFIAGAIQDGIGVIYGNIKV